MDHRRDTASAFLKDAELKPMIFSMATPTASANDGRAMITSALRTRLTLIASILTLLWPCQNAFAEVGAPFLVKDIEAGPAYTSPRDLIDFAGTLYFAIDPGTRASELWRTDARAAATTRITGPYDGIKVPGDFTILKDRLYFWAITHTTGYEIWRTDGTDAGTELVADIYPGPGSSRPRDMVVLNEVLYFRADDGPHGSELWRSDGTAGGTWMVIDIQPGSRAGSLPHDLTPLGNHLYFRAGSAVSGTATWQSDGTATGTLPLAEVVGGAVVSEPDQMVAVGDVVFLVVDDGIHGPELWRTDGSSAGSMMVSDLRPGPEGSNLGSMYALGDELVFFANDLGTGYRMWRTDGTMAGTRLADDLLPYGYYRWPAAGAAVNGFRIFDDGILQPHTGIFAGRSGEPTVTFLSNVGASRFVVEADFAFFSGYRSSDGASLWLTDGTPTGTFPVNPTSAPKARIEELTRSGRFLYFTGADEHGLELWAIRVGPAVCGDGILDVDVLEACDDGNTLGGDCCSPTCEIESATTVCRPAIGACDVAEMCSGSSGTCPTDSFVASGDACADDGNACTSDVCDGVGTCTHPVAAGLPCQDDGSYCTEDYCDGNGSCIHPAARAGEICRAASGDCDVPEVCDGLAPFCPNDVFKPATQVCRGSAGACDVAESCTGSSASCPGDAKAPSGTQCPPDAESCTADICDGNGACTHPAGNAGTACRAAAGDCDVAEQCDGTMTACPTDRFKPATTVCRDSAGVCDVPDTCSGTGPNCTSDTRAASGTPCIADALICTADICDGTSVACTHPAGNVGMPCRTSASACDLAENCDGVAIECPPDTGLSDRDSDGQCDAQDPCTNDGGQQDFASPPRSKVVLAKINTDTTPNNDNLKITALLALPEGKRFADLRPHINGARVVIEGAGGTRPLDALLPAGAYSAATRTGWTTSRSGRAWTYVDRRATPTSGIVKLTVTDRNRSSTPRQVKVVVTGKNGLYPVAPLDVPVQAIVALGNAADAAAGMCGESAYSPGSCAFNRTGNQLICSR